MSYMLNGEWQTGSFEPSTEDGAFERADSQFRDWVSTDGSGPFPAEPDRYHLYVSLACPWAHRTLIIRRLKKLEQVIGVSVVHPYMGDEGWTFGECPGCTPDHVNGFHALYQAYALAEPSYSGIVTVPVLWDKKSRRIVNNESSEIIRMLNSAFDQWGDGGIDFYPEALRAEIDAVNDFVYDAVNNGVYKAGFSTEQAQYDTAVEALFAALDALEERLGSQRYLVDDRITEADWRLFTTLARFDSVYYSHFKCNLRRLVDYPNLWGYTRELYQAPGVAETLNLEHIKQHYYTSHPTLNPSGIVPKGPAIDFDEPRRRPGSD